jgi:hypothetical protein
MKYFLLLLLIACNNTKTEPVKVNEDSLRIEELSSMLIRQSDSLDARKEAVTGSPISDSLYSEILLRVTDTERKIKRLKSK